MIFVRLTLCNLVNFLLNVLYHCLDSKVDKDLTTITSQFQDRSFLCNFVWCENCINGFAAV